MDNMTKIPLPTSPDEDIRYYTDGHKVYYGSGYEVKKADLETFEVYIGWFAKDKNHCFFQGNAFKKADMLSFEVLNWACAKDKNNVYTNRGILKNANPQTYEVFGDGIGRRYSALGLYPGGYGKDDSHVFYYMYGTKTLMFKDADPHSFAALEGLYGKDNNFVFGNGKKLKDANPETWRLFGEVYEGYSHDGKNVYHGEIRVKGADPETFEIVVGKNGFHYGKDENSVYHGVMRLTENEIRRNRIKERNCEHENN